MSERVGEDWFEGESAGYGPRKIAALPGYAFNDIYIDHTHNNWGDVVCGLIKSIAINPWFYLCLSLSASSPEDVEPGEIRDATIPSLVSMNIPPPSSPKPMSRDRVLQNQANNRWEQHKLTGWKGPDPPVRVEPQVPPTNRSSVGAWKRGGTLHSVPFPRLPVTPIPRAPQERIWGDHSWIGLDLEDWKIQIFQGFGFEILLLFTRIAVCELNSIKSLIQSCIARHWICRCHRGMKHEYRG